MNFTTIVINDEEIKFKICRRGCCQYEETFIDIIRNENLITRKIKHEAYNNIDTIHYIIQDDQTGHYISSKEYAVDKSVNSSDRSKNQQRALNKAKEEGQTKFIKMLINKSLI